MAFELPHMPTKEEVFEKAVKLANVDRERVGLPPYSLAYDPYVEKELKEGSYWDRARRELMSGVRSQLEEYLHYLESEAERIREELGIEKPPPPEERIRELELEISTLREKYEATKRRLKEAEEEIRRLEEKLKAPPPAPPPPPPKPPVKVPPPKVLPPVPERCPIDGTPLRQIERVPIGPIPVRLSAEEEYFRSRLGLPIPEKEIVWLDIPPTMKVWICERDHLFERDATGRLVQRTPEFIYRKILRERARLEKIVYPPRVAPPVVSPIYRRPPLPRPVKTQDLWWAWLERVKGISREQYMKLSESEKKRLIQEWVEYMRRGR